MGRSSFDNGDDVRRAFEERTTVAVVLAADLRTVDDMVESNGAMMTNHGTPKQLVLNLSFLRQ